MKNRRTKIKFPVFNGYEIRVIVARDVEATGRRLNADCAGAEAFFCPHSDEHPRGVAWLVLGRDATPDVVAHEATHVVRALFAYAGVGQDEEAFAYHVAHVVERLHKFLKGRK